MAAAGRRMSRYDRVFLGYEVTKVIGPLAGVTPAGLRATLARLHHLDPGHPAVCGIVPGPPRWRRYSEAEFRARLADLIVLLGPDAPDGLDELTAYAHHAIPLGDRSLVLAEHRGYAIAKFAHCLGSGAYLNNLIAGILLAAADDEPLRLPSHRRAPFLLGRAVLRHFGRHPGRVGRMFGLARPHPIAPESTRVLSGWRSSLTTCGDRSSSEAPAALRAWRARQAPDVSIASTVFAALWSAFAHAGLSPDPAGLVLLVDGQRYLAGGTDSGPNFIIGQYLAPGAPHQPRSIHRTLHAAMDSGRPLAAMVDRLLRQPHDIGDDKGTVLATKPRPKLILTFGRLDMFKPLPWSVPTDQIRHTNVSSVAEPSAISVAVWELADALHVATSFHTRVFTEASVRHALRLFCSDPVALLPAAADD